MLDHTFRVEIFPYIQSKLPLVQLEAIFSHPTACYLGEDADPHYSLLSGSFIIRGCIMLLGI